LHRFAGTCLNACHHLLDFRRRLRSAVRRRAHFIGNHGKPATCFTRTGGFNGRIECQQIGLLGNRANHVQHLANVTSLRGQTLDQTAGGFSMRRSSPSAPVRYIDSATNRIRCPI